MADIIGDGKERWDWVPSVANIASPTLSELTAGMRISQYMTADGATGFAPDTAAAPTSNLESTFDTAVNGRRSFSGTRLRLKRQTTPDTAYTTLIPDATGFLVRRKSLAAAAAYVAAQPVQVFPVMCGEAALMDLEANMPERYEVPILMTSQPNLRATVAA
ncbi:hypothetical protein GCM10010435_44450 [Winogradskya consettensis]|uniref:Uncharacterized protein n=1 Tax=Winogradskya consettensis TaxID=113560 RepID=A0A919T2P5_9ACTN|nr:hypothetical protein [Actinoplanes consettensis]GIM82702.1 hypothetical protein Aco04nite_82840 [Actinoplanes consettensis]